MPKRKNNTSARQQFKKLGLPEIATPGGGLKRIISKTASRAIPRLVRVAGKKIRVNNPLGARQVPVRRRRAKFRIRRGA